MPLSGIWKGNLGILVSKNTKLMWKWQKSLSAIICLAVVPTVFTWEKSHVVNWLKFSENCTVQLGREMDVQLKKYVTSIWLFHMGTVCNKNVDRDLGPDRSTVVALNTSQQLYVVQ